MKRTLKRLMCAVMALTALVSCQKEKFSENVYFCGEKILVSIAGSIGEFVSVDNTKAVAQSVVRVNWAQDDKVYVYDGSECLGTLTVTPDEKNASFALLSGTITASKTTPAKLTLVYSNTATEAPAISDSKVSIDLSNQSGADVPFVLYATIDYDTEKLEKSSEYVPFSFATSVMTVNVTDLPTGTENAKIDITKAEIDEVSTFCELTITSDAEPTVAGTTKGKITRSAGFNQSDSRGMFTIALAAETAAQSARKILVYQGSKVSGAPFATTTTFTENKSYNTVCQLSEYINNAPAVKVTGISLNSKDAVEIGASKTLVATITPSDASHKEINWSSSDEAVATVDENGEVTGVAAGLANITATTVDGNFTAVCLVTIVAPLPAGALPGVFSVSDDEGTHVKQIYFSQGNLWYGPVSGDATATFNFETNQNDFLPASETDYHDDHISYFYWSKDARVACSYIKYDDANTQYEIVPDESDVFFTNADGFKVTVDGEEQTGWRTLTVNEWKYLFDTRVVNGGTGQGYSYSWAITYGGKYGLVIYPDNYTGDPISGEVSILPEGVVFLLGAGNRIESLKKFTNLGSVSYWASTPTAAGVTGGPRGSSISCNYPATWMNTGATTTSRKNCYCIRLITECQ